MGESKSREHNALGPEIGRLEEVKKLKSPNIPNAFEIELRRCAGAWRRVVANKIDIFAWRALRVKQLSLDNSSADAIG